MALSETKHASARTATRCDLRELIVQKAKGRGQLPATITDFSLARWEDQLNFIINKV